MFREITKILSKNFAKSRKFRPNFDFVFCENFAKLEENFAKHEIKISRNFREITKTKIFVTTLLYATQWDDLSSTAAPPDAYYPLWPVVSMLNNQYFCQFVFDMVSMSCALQLFHSIYQFYLPFMSLRWLPHSVLPIGRNFFICFRFISSTGLFLYLYLSNHNFSFLATPAIAYVYLHQQPYPYVNVKQQQFVYFQQQLHAHNHFA